MRINDFVATAAAVFAVPIRRDETCFTARSAPDELSKRLLREGADSLEAGARDAAGIPAAITHNLPRILETNLARMTPDTAMAWVDGLADLELEHLSRLYVDANAQAARPGELLKVAALRLDTLGLMRLSRFFGYDALHEAVSSTAPRKAPALAAACTIRYPTAIALLPRREAIQPAAAVTGGTHAASTTAATPAVSQTIRQVYAGFRSLHAGDLAAVAAIYETAAYCGEQLVATWGTGFYFGSQVAGLMQDYAPDWYRDKFAPGVGAPLDYLQSLVLTIGRYYPGAAPCAPKARPSRFAFAPARR